MADCVGPGRGAHVKNTSTNSTTPSSRTAFKKQVSNLINQFEVPAESVAKMSSETSKTNQTPEEDQPKTPEGEDAAKMSQGTSYNQPTEVTNQSAEAEPEAAATAMVTYAGVADRTNLEQDYVVTLWFRKNNTVSNVMLSIEQKGRLFYKRLMIPPGKLISVDESRRDQIRLKIHGSVPVSSLHLTQSFEAKPGLWTKPVAPVVKEKMVYVYWTSHETSYRELEYTLEQFGVLTGNIEFQVYRAKAQATEEERLMDGVMNMDRKSR